MAKLRKPGQKPAKPGKYIERGQRGGKVNNPKRAIVKEQFPPTKKSGNKWERPGPINR
ncbi:MAG: YjzC family protein [Anaerolineae bacterium]|nr:YjzC family protein [Anaerolineae bacterium]